MNKIATIEKILSVRAHPNADRLDLVKVLGYQCVSERGLHKEGDLILYIQPDSVLPVDDGWAETYRKYSPTRIKAIKLRNEFSEGILVKQSQLNIEKEWSETDVGTDLSEILGITHYERPTPSDLSAKGPLPFGLPKTDQERMENMVERLPFGEPVDVTLKIDGQSWSAYYNLDTDEFGVTGRTLEYKTDAINKYTDQIKRYDIKNKLIEYCKSIGKSLCIRGESYGPGIQSSNKNPHSKRNRGLAIFSVYLIKEHRYAGKGHPQYFPNVCKALDLPSVPIIEKDVILTQELLNKYSVELKNINGEPFEGVVINHGPYEIKTPSKDLVYPDGVTRHIKGDIQKFGAGSFKCINKKYDSEK